MHRTIVLAATAFAQSVIAFVTSSWCSAQDEASRVMLASSPTTGSMESMTAGLGPLTLFVAFQVAVMTLLAAVIALLLRRPVQAPRSAPRSTGGAPTPVVPRPSAPREQPAR